jgi:hypothetical protein
VSFATHGRGARLIAADTEEASTPSAPSRTP